MTKIPLFKVFMPQEVGEAVTETLQSGYLAEGKKVMEFREILREFLGTQYIIPTNSCTTALTIAYTLAGVGPGTEVITTPLTSIATNTPILNLGAEIVWADCDPKTGMIDPSKLEQLITEKTKAIVVLHKDGDLAKLDEISEIAKNNNIKIVEDAAHALGAKYKGKNIGTISDYTCFSFQAIKHITTGGDGGILTCANEKDFLLGKKMKWLGTDKEVLGKTTNTRKADVEILGYKGNMNEVSATIGIEAMKYASDILSRYHENGILYDSLFKEVEGVEVLEREEDCYSAFWTYVLLVPDREKVVKALANEGVEAMAVHPRNDEYSIFKKYRRHLQGVDYFAAHELSLPCGWWVNKSDMQRIVNIIKENV